MKSVTQRARPQTSGEAPAVSSGSRYSVCVLGLTIAEPLRIDLEVTTVGADGARDTIPIRLRLPEGTRSLLAMASWSSGHTISGAMQRIAEEYVRLLIAQHGALPAAAGPAARAQLHEIPRKFLRDRLEALIQ